MTMAEGMRLSGKTAIVTGSSSGIGRAIALAFASQNARLVVCADIIEKPNTSAPEDKDLETSEEIVRLYGEDKALFMQCDVSNEDDVEDLIEAVVERTGRIDVLVNNAGVGVLDYKTHEMDADEWDKAMRINAKGPFLCSKHALGQFLIQLPDGAGERGAIINISSIGGTSVGLFECSAYCASTSAVAGFTRALAVEYAGTGIRSNAICPGYIDTKMIEPFLAIDQFAMYLRSAIPSGGIAKPADVAGAAVWLACSMESRYVNGVMLPVDGGFVAR